MEGAKGAARSRAFPIDLQPEPARDINNVGPCEQLV
jgi:hypothetical protein